MRFTIDGYCIGYPVFVYVDGVQEDADNREGFKRATLRISCGSRLLQMMRRYFLFL